MFLTELKKGEKAKIKDLSSIHTVIQRRLLDLGIIEGIEICYKAALPFGGPFILEYSGQDIGVRRGVAASIGVERL